MDVLRRFLGTRGGIVGMKRFRGPRDLRGLQARNFLAAYQSKASARSIGRIAAHRRGLIEFSISPLSEKTNAFGGTYWKDLKFELTRS